VDLIRLVRDPQLFLMFASIWHMRIASLCGRSLACYQSNGMILLVMSIFFCLHIIFHQYSNIQLSVYCLKHRAQTCGSTTPTDSQTFYQRFVLTVKLTVYSLQTRRYDVSTMSPAAKNI